MDWNELQDGYGKWMEFIQPTCSARDTIVVFRKIIEDFCSDGETTEIATCLLPLLLFAHKNEFYLCEEIKKIASKFSEQSEEAIIGALMIASGKFLSSESMRHAVNCGHLLFTLAEKHDYRVLERTCEIYKTIKFHAVDVKRKDAVND